MSQPRTGSHGLKENKMAIPSYDQFISPLLLFLASQHAPVRKRDADEAVANALGLTESERRELLPSGSQSVHANRMGWAHDRLKRAGLSSSVRRGIWLLTERGREYASRFPTGLSDSEIVRLASIEDPVHETLKGLVHPNAQPTSLGGPQSRPAPHLPSSSQPFVPPAISPDERIEAAIDEIRGSVATELLESIASASPLFFEGLVLDLLHAMGYGMSRADLQQTKRSGDGGIDGIISLDRLGLQKVYVQAKRWSGPVSSNQIRDFIGALTTQGASMGVFITSSTYTKDALRTAEMMRGGSLVLVDGARLANLMMDHRVGVSHNPVFIPTVDGDYFE